MYIRLLIPLDGSKPAEKVLPYTRSAEGLKPPKASRRRRHCRNSEPHR